ncbi:hypothetical protein [Nocardia sp. NPDC051750]|uniref:hypothetical protein n=1 Tax=Nocardia sp. NPDC051750 TaxID=3364325 RepID=UPI0037982BED
MPVPLCWPGLDQSAAPWHSGPGRALGDAMHTMCAHLGAGGVMALESGVVLGQELAGGGDLGGLLTRFAAVERDGPG